MSNNQQVSTGEATPSSSQDEGADSVEVDEVDRADRGDGADDLAGKRRRGQDFPRTRFPRRGYDCTQVEDFLHEAERAMRYTPPAMAPYEVQDARFRGVRFRQGYDMVAVDDRMEELHATLRDAHGDDSVSSIQGHESVRQHRVAFWIYVGAAVLVVLIVGFAFTQF